MRSNITSSRKNNKTRVYKKLIISALFMIGVTSCAQYYPASDNYGNESGSYYNNGDYYGENYDYPDDYYYNYPTDYYPQSYYQSYYNDYRNSIVSIDWSRFFRKYRLSRYQIDQILYLNQQYPTYNSWGSYYNSNPDRWYYERFFALQNILGPQIFAVYQNNYYQGYSPVVYFQNYRRTHYVPRYHVQRQYKNVNVDRYRVDRNTYKDPRANNGLYDPTNRSNSNSGFRNNSLNGTKTPTRENNGFRSDTRSGNSQATQEVRANDNNRNNGFRSGANSNNNIAPASPQPRVETRSNNGLRNGNTGNSQPQRTQPKVETRSNNGFRSENSESRSTEKPATREVKTESKTSTNGGGFR